MKSQKNSKQVESPAVLFLLERLSEVLKDYQDDEGASEVIHSGYQYMMDCFEERFVDPKFTRDVESLEAMLFSFISHCANEDALNELTNHLGDSKKGTLQ